MPLPGYLPSESEVSTCFLNYCNKKKNKRFILTHSELTGSGAHPKEEKQTDPDIGFKGMLNLDVQTGFGSDAILKYGSGSVFDTL